MHPARVCLLLSVFIAAAANGAIVYKWTDASGVVHYSDQPVPGAEKIVTSSISTNGIGGTGRGGGGSAGTPPSSQSAAFVSTQLSINSPAKEQVFFGDDIVPVRLTLDPALRPNQTITWSLNGQPMTDQPPNAMNFALQMLDRGTYVLTATLTDSATGETKTSDSVTFYKRQNSELQLQHRVH